MISVYIYGSNNSREEANMETNEAKVRKGAWTKEEDLLLTKCIQQFGEGKWHLVPHRAGLNRCRKSCRMRWLNYLQPNVKRGYFDPAEVDLVQRLHKLLGNRWSLIAGRIPGRTANDVKNFWNTHICKKQQQQQPSPKKPTNQVIKPLPRNLTRLSKPENDDDDTCLPSSSSSPLVQGEDCSQWWRELLQMSENGKGSEDPFNGGQPEYGDDGFMTDLLAEFHVYHNII